MASYFVTGHAQADGAHAVHDRALCPPACFPYGDTPEYLGEFTEAGQAIAVARLRYLHVRRCACCEPLPLMPPIVSEPRALYSLRT